MLHFHVNLFAHPESIQAGIELILRGERFVTLGDPLGNAPRFTTPLPFTFEQIQQRLLSIERMDVEPDGYFVVAGEQAGIRWQIDGHLHEYEGKMHRVELHGTCGTAMLDRLLGCCRWPETPLLFELVREGITLDEADFRRWAALLPLPPVNS